MLCLGADVRCLYLKATIMGERYEDLFSLRVEFQIFIKAGVFSTLDRAHQPFELAGSLSAVFMNGLIQTGQRVDVRPQKVGGQFREAGDLLLRRFELLLRDRALVEGLPETFLELQL